MKFANEPCIGGQRVANISDIVDDCVDVMIGQQLEDVVQVSPRQTHVACVQFSARDDAGLVVS